MLINEIHYTDMYPPVFQEFRKKYLALLRKRQTGDLYVQFSDFADNTMDRNPHTSPDHSDMVGVYAYPIAYVLQYPADIWYGQGSKYMRVLQKVSKKSFDLSYIDSIGKCERFLNHVGFDPKEIDNMMFLANKHFKNRVSGPNKFAKLFLSCLQIDLISPPDGEIPGGMFSKSRPNYRIRTGKEQSDLFLKAGIDAVIDSSKNNKSAIINDREPEQICFLTRAAFRVVEVYDLRGGMSKEKLPSKTTSDPSRSYIERAFVASIATMMDDKISESSNDAKTSKKLDMAYRYYWTKKGRRIEVQFERPSSYYAGKKMGEKGHKESKLYSLYNTKVTIDSEFGSIKNSFSATETFADILGTIQRQWRDLMENPQKTDWTPENADSFMDKRKKEKDEYHKEESRKRREEDLKEVPYFLQDTKYLAEYYKLPFTPDTDEDNNLELMRLLQFFSNRSRQQGELPIEDLIKGWYETCEHWLDVNNRWEHFKPMVHQLGAIIAAAAPKHSWELKSGKHMMSRIVGSLKDRSLED